MPADVDKVVAIPLSWWERIKRAVLFSENGEQGGGNHRGPLRGTGGVAAVVTAVVLPPAPNANGYYQANIVQKNSKTGVWSPTSVATPPAVVSVADPNGATLTVDSRYSVVSSGVDPTDGTTPAFLVTGGSGGSLVKILVGSNGVVPGPINTVALSGTPNSHGFYDGALGGTGGPLVRIKNVNGKPLAANSFVLGSPIGIDPTDGVTPAYLTDVGGVTGTWTYYSNVACLIPGMTTTSWTDTWLNGALVSRV